MNIAVFGATGSVGRLLVDQALEQGHQVTAVTRDRGRISTRHDRLRVVEADPTDPDQVTPALAGVEAVLIVIGGGAKGGIRGPSTAAVVEAMQRAGVRRLICESTVGIGDSRPNLNFWWKYVMFGLLLRAAYADHEAQEEHVRRSGLDWTVVRPTVFTDGPRTGDYQHGFGPKVRTSLKISRADVADFMLTQLDDDSYRGRAVALSY